MIMTHYLSDNTVLNILQLFYQYWFWDIQIEYTVYWVQAV